jgi:hypothetical protein
MPMSPEQIVRRQDEILKAMSKVRLMQRGTLSRQAYPERATRRDGNGVVGPYCLWQGTVGGKRFGKRLSGAQAKRVEEGIAQRHAFEALCEEYVELSCRLAALEDKGGAWELALKKRRKSRSSKARKSNG